MSKSPYKFLDYYESGDEEIFFGREREIKILMSDVIVSRLVVLFAKTGTGKTSLINAGVRPRLEARGYSTYFLRVRNDPVESTRIELQKQLDIKLTGQSLVELMREIDKRFEKQSRVFFFDQFEEFFIWVKSEPDRVRQFISDVAHLSEDKECGVHFVFSMREEWFHEMNEFRDQIPTIFHNDSNLRLCWFDKEQARLAIEEPARVFGVTIDPQLVDELIRDLSDPAEGGGIEPAQLQIVCDTLWQLHEGGHIDVSQYRQLGECREKSLPIAQQVLLQRLTQEFEKIESKDELDLLVRVLPELRTTKKTKNLWEIEALALHIKAPLEELRKLVRDLVKSRMIRTTERDGLQLLELAHDYLVERLDEIALRVGFVWPRRVLKTAWQAHLANGDLAGALELETISAHAAGLTITPEQLDFLFHSALVTGTHTQFWFRRAEAADIDVWIVLGAFLHGTNLAVAYSVIRLLSELKNDQALELLEEALHRDDLTSSVVEVLGGMQTLSAINLLERNSRRQQWLPQVRVALDRLSRSRDGTIAQRSREMLKDLTEAEIGQRDLEGGTKNMRQIDSGVSVPFPVIQTLLREGEIVCFLGTGVGVADRTYGEDWTMGSKFLPTQRELSEYLAKKCGFPSEDDSERGDLARVASYYSLMNGRRLLDKEFRRIYAGNFPIPSLHRYLAQVSVPQLIVTSNFDTLLEQAFDEAGHRYKVVTYPAGHHEYRRSFFLMDSELRSDFVKNEPRVVSANDLYKIELRETTVIYKIHGSVAPNPAFDSFMITEEDNFGFLAQSLTAFGGIPPLFMDQFSHSSFLFLGWNLRHWIARQTLNLLSPMERDSDASRILGISTKRSHWAIQSHSSEVERYEWDARNINLYNLDLLEFVNRLRDRE